MKLRFHSSWHYGVLRIECFVRREREKSIQRYSSHKPRLFRLSDERLDLFKTSLRETNTSEKRGGTTQANHEMSSNITLKKGSAWNNSGLWAVSTKRKYKSKEKKQEVITCRKNETTSTSWEGEPGWGIVRHSFRMSEGFSVNFSFYKTGEKFIEKPLSARSA